MPKKKGHCLKELERPKEFKELIDPAALLRLAGNDLVVLKMDTDNPQEDRKAYSNLIDGVTRSVTGLGELKEIKTLNDFYTTLSEAKEKVLVIHALGKFKERMFNHFLMVVKRSVYVLAVGSKDGWKEVEDSVEYPIDGAKSFGFSGGYYGTREGLRSGKIQLGFKELKKAILKLIFEEPTSKDILTVALNICEAVRFRFIFNKVYNLIGKFNIIECCEPCAETRFLTENWGNIAKAIEDFQNGGGWKFDIKGNVIDGKEFVTQESVLQLVRVIKKSGNGNEEKVKKNEEKVKKNKRKSEN